MRRYAFFGHHGRGPGRLRQVRAAWAIPFRDEQGENLIFRRPVVVDKLVWRRKHVGEEFAYAPRPHDEARPRSR